MLSIFINDLPGSARAAFLREGKLERLVLDRPGAMPLVGDIYLGRVTKVLAGIQAAFIDLGREQPGFLNRSDLPRSWFPAARTGIESVLKQGQALVVQVKKEPFREKTARVSTDVKLVGFSCILLAQARNVSFSKKFKGDRQEVLTALSEAGSGDREPWGWIIRSAAARTPLAVIREEARHLTTDYRQIREQGDHGACRLLFRQDPILESLRALHEHGVRSIICDGEQRLQGLQHVLQQCRPALLPALQLHQSKHSIFDIYKVTSEIEEALDGRIWLTGGGFLEIHQNEALVSIDVNSAKNLKGRAGVSVAQRTNLEAVPVIARQIRARNLAGLIVIDFINAGESDWHRSVEQALARELARDPVRIDFIGISRLGLAELSRERQGLDLQASWQERCPICRGDGVIRRLSSAAIDVQQQLLREGRGMAGEGFLIRCSPALAVYLETHRAVLLDPLAESLRLCLKIKRDGRLFPRGFELEVM